MITRAIADGLGLSIEEAEQLKRTKAGIPESAAGSIFGGFGGGSTQQFQSYNPFADDPAMMNPSLTPMGMPGDQPTPYSAGEPREDQPVAGAYDEPPAQPAPEELPTTPVPVGVPAEADDPETVRIYNAMASVIEEFVAEVRRSIDYFRSKGGDVDRIELMGGGAKLRGLDAFLSKTLGIPTEVYDPLRNIQVSAKKLDQEIVDQNRQDLAVAIGNALHIAFD